MKISDSLKLIYFIIVLNIYHITFYFFRLKNVGINEMKPKINKVRNISMLNPNYVIYFNANPVLTSIMLFGIKPVIILIYQ